MALRTMSRFSSSVGAILIAASVTSSGLSWPFTSSTKTWLMRRSVRSPWSLFTTAAISSSVCSEPFFSASSLQCLAKATAFSAAAWLCGASTISTPASESPASRAAASIFARGPMRMGIISPLSRAASAASTATPSHGWTMPILTGGKSAARSISASKNRPLAAGSAWTRNGIRLSRRLARETITRYRTTS